MRRSVCRAHELEIEIGACGMHTSYRRSMGKVGSTLKRPCFPRRFAGAFSGAASSVFLVRARLAGFLAAGRALDMIAFERIHTSSHRPFLSVSAACITGPEAEDIADEKIVKKREGEYGRWWW